MPLPAVIQLRQTLADKFPGLRLRLNDPSAVADIRPKALSPLLDLFENHFVKGALHEIVAGGKSSGSAALMDALMDWAAAQNQIIALVDGSDSFDVTAVEPSALARLLWVRCPDADTALKAMDLLLRDGNLSLILLDLKINPESQLRKIPATTWYRLQRLAESVSTVCVTVTPLPLIAPAQTRVTLRSDFSLHDLERDTEDVLRELKWEVADSRHARALILHSA